MGDLEKDESAPVVTGRKKGGIARAKALSVEDRHHIAQKAASQRWGIVEALKSGALEIGAIEIDCAVLPNGTRILSERAVAKAFGAKRGGSHWRRKKAGAVGADLPVYISATNLAESISDELKEKLSAPVKYRVDGKLIHGIEASILPEICDILLRAREEKKLHPSQEPIAQQAEILMRSLAKIGIVALIDEATGYQEIREKYELQAMLDMYLRQELAAWAKRFPDEFYEHIYRLRGWQWKGRTTNPPQVVAHYTKDIVYARLAPSALNEIEKKNPLVNGRRKAKHHQWLSDEVGIPALSMHMHAVITLLKLAPTWDQFMVWLDQAHPRQGDTLQLPLMSDFSVNELPLIPGK